MWGVTGGACEFPNETGGIPSSSLAGRGASQPSRALCSVLSGLIADEERCSCKQWFRARPPSKSSESFLGRDQLCWQLKEPLEKAESYKRWLTLLWHSNKDVSVRDLTVLSKPGQKKDKASAIKSMRGGRTKYLDRRYVSHVHHFYSYEKYNKFHLHLIGPAHRKKQKPLQVKMAVELIFPSPFTGF